MITGELKGRVDRVWDAFWSGGISNPLEVIEQITYLLFIRRLDDNHTREVRKANRLKQPIENAVFTPPAELQLEFADRVTKVLAERASSRAALGSQDDLFASVQSRAFRGEL